MYAAIRSAASLAAILLQKISLPRATKLRRHFCVSDFSIANRQRRRGQFRRRSRDSFHYVYVYFIAAVHNIFSKI